MTEKHRNQMRPTVKSFAALIDVHLLYQFFENRAINFLDDL
jgi:hypothetical protein